MATTIPPDTQYFTCTQAVCLPAVHVPTGFASTTKLFADGYFRNWEKLKTSDPSRSAYLSEAFRKSVLPALAPVVVSDISQEYAAYCWRVRSGVAITWETVYQDFPWHGVSQDKHQVVPWIFLQDLVFGWSGIPAVIPRNDRGALLMLGDAGLSVLAPSGAISVGRTKALVQASYFASVGPTSWVLALPRKDQDTRPFPPDMTLITVQ